MVKGPCTGLRETFVFDLGYEMLNSTWIDVNT